MQCEIKMRSKRCTRQFYLEIQYHPSVVQKTSSPVNDVSVAGDHWPSLGSEGSFQNQEIWH